MTTVFYEGVPIRPDPGIWWSLVEKYQARVMTASPTAIRLLRKQDPKYLQRHDVSSLRTLFLMGEPLDESTSNWIRDALALPVIDNYWQTETGWPILALPSSTPHSEIKPGSPGLPCFGYRTTIVDPATGEDLARGQKGVMACELPLPPGCLSTIWQNDQLFEKHYFQQIPGRHLYSTFDAAEKWGQCDAHAGPTIRLGASRNWLPKARTSTSIKLASSRLKYSTCTPAPP